MERPISERPGHGHSFCKSRLFVWAVQVLVEDLGHGEHVNSVLLEDRSHRIVASNLATITGVLKVVIPNVLPDLLYCLRTRKL